MVRITPAGPGWLRPGNEWRQPAPMDRQPPFNEQQVELRRAAARAPL